MGKSPHIMWCYNSQISFKNQMFRKMWFFNSHEVFMKIHKTSWFHVYTWAFEHYFDCKYFHDGEGNYAISCTCVSWKPLWFEGFPWWEILWFTCMSECF
jgi:hypothetical protein